MKIKDINDIDELGISDNSAGVYILFKVRLKTATDIKVKPYYVGRSDSNLRERIKTSAKERECKYVWFKETTFPKNAYLLECEYYHKYEGILDNEIHPDVSNGAYWRCPIEGRGWGY